MKTSNILLMAIAVITLTGMIATDVLLRQQYQKIDWSNPYQTYSRQTGSSVRHWVIDGAPENEVIVELDTAQAGVFVHPQVVTSFRIKQQGDTAYVAFNEANSLPNEDGLHDPKSVAGYELRPDLVLRLPDLQSIRITNGHLTLRKSTTGNLAVNLNKSRLRTNQLQVNGRLSLVASRNSCAVLGADRYQSLQVTVRDSSSIQLKNTQTTAFMAEVSPKAEVQLQGQALQWLTSKPAP